MQNTGGEAASPPPNMGPAKRTRRPSVRLHQPYYENPGHRKVQRQWVDFQGSKKPRTVKTVHWRSKEKKKSDGVSDCDKVGEELNFDDDIAIGNWKSVSGGGDFKRKRVRSSKSKKWGSGKSPENRDLEIVKASPSSVGEFGEHEQREEEQEQEPEEEDLGDKINSNSAMQALDPYSPNCSFDNCDDGNEKLSDDNNNVAGGQQGRNQRGESINDPNLTEMRVRSREEDGDENGVRMWLNGLQLGKYATLFEVHGVDDEVLPFLTLEDLKDMGINEVGTRRKLYSSIQKLNKGLL